MSGLDLQQRLVAARVELPIVFISAHDDPVAREQALAAGGLAFLRKPFSEDALMDAVRSGLARGRKGSPIEKP
jgi:FixJ family two-component response regulator